MDVPAVLEQVSAVLALEGLRATPYPPSGASPPCAWVEVDRVDYRFAGASHVRLALRVVVIVGRPEDRSSYERLAEHLSDDTGLVAALEANAAGGVADSAVVTDTFVEHGELAGTPCIIAQIDLEIIGD